MEKIQKKFTRLTYWPNSPEDISLRHPQKKSNIRICYLMWCEQFGIRYYSATPKERYFVEEVTRVTWAKRQEEKTGVKRAIRPAFSA